ncbi:hypothetical protein XENOCAPTIV_013655, partial [Xenoophorus captivus]
VFVCQLSCSLICLFLTDYSCALQKDILLQGRLYLSENWLCFYSNIFRWETTVGHCGCLLNLTAASTPAQCCRHLFLVGINKLRWFNAFSIKGILFNSPITIQLKDVTSMTKEKTAKLIPNAIQISTENDKVCQQSAEGCGFCLTFLL